MTKNKSSYKLVFIAVMILLFIFALGILIGYSIKLTSHKPTSMSNQKADFNYVSKRVQQNNPNHIIINFRELRDNLNNYVQKEGKEINLYFEYLPTGTSIGINEDEVMSGGSLSKIAFVMQTYKLIDQNKINPKDNVIIKPEYLDDGWGNLHYSGVNRQISIENLAYETIINSDNTALNTLTFEVNKTYPENLFRELGILHPKISEFDISIETSPKEYIKLLKSLYFSSYLSYESSNKILDLMTKIKDGEGLRADIPKNIKIAHKIGFNIDTKDPDVSMISDCGIVYVPDKPYILCVMVQDNKESAQENIQDISNMIYNYIINKSSTE